ncbi:prepilin-type N-terminal cleavage/methylation domain-containing protein [Lachnospiraceae bacterium PF1-21]|uniref:prepilin-type N-terminal cleavage/methylation domain-containing protein n=1 Tax=Ohessyouella blattaphilus TaxID=2949333 RepID=UPI003E2C13C5
MRKNKGFTLVELVVVMAIMAILASGVTFGVIEYQKHAQFKKSNEYAEMLFLAAQSQLTYYKSSGELEDFAKEFKDANKVSTEIATYAKDLNNKNKQIRLVHVDLSPTEEKLTDSLVYKLTKDYIGDKSIYNGAIRIELEPASGTVFSVSYSTRAESFVEEDKDATASALSVSVAMRESESRRKEVMLGYYDTDIHLRKMKASEESGEVGEIDTDETGLINDETLRIVIGFEKNNIQVIQNGQYEIKIFNKGETKKPICSFMINSDSDNALSVSGASKKVISTVKYGDGKLESQKCIFETYITADGKLGIILDAIDIEAARALNAAGGDVDKATAVTTYANTYSGMRLNLFKTAKIQAEIAVMNDDNVVKSRAMTNSESAFFKANSDNGNNIKDAELSYPRHLYNVRFYEGNKGNNSDISYKQVADLDFEKTIKASPEAVYDNDNSLESNFLNDKAYFPAIPFLGAKSKLSGGQVVNGNASKTTAYKLENFVVVARAATNDSAMPNALGLVATNKGKIENLAVEDIVLEAEESLELSGVGGLVGINEGTIDNVYMKDAKVTAKNSNNVGGFVGLNTAKGSFSMNTYGQGGDGDTGGVPLIYRNLSENIEVNGKENVGGLFGINKGVTSHSKRNQYFSIDKVTIKGEGCIGGLIGRNEAKVGNFMVFEAKVEASGDYAGGAIGYNDANYVLETGPSDEEVYPRVNALGGYRVSGASNVGGIAGANTRTGTIEYYCARKQEVTASGNFVGGLVGDNSGKIEITSGSSIYRGQVVEASVTSKGSYVGGIAGRNSGIISGYQVEKSTITGNDQVGGAIGENSGQYLFSSNRTLILDQVTVSGASNVGGIIGNNNTTNALLQDIQIQASSVTGTGNNVGGALGNNQGIYKFISNKVGVLDKIAVSGASNVGGIIGNNSAANTLLQDIKIQDSSVTGTGNNVGGALGNNQGIYQFISNKVGVLDKITVSGGSNVGGIIGNCDGTGVVLENVDIKASNIVGTSSNIGGAIGRHTGTYTFTYDNRGVLTQVTVSGGSNVGGVLGVMENGASLEKIKVNGITINGSGACGGLIGVNNGALDLAKNNSISGTITFSATAEGGALVGSNAGTISGNPNNSNQEVKATLIFSENSEVSANNRGGIAGKNSGTITGAVFGGTISGNYGLRYGGITGYNSGTISNSFMNTNLTIGKQLTADKPLIIGGIAGENGGTIADSGYRQTWKSIVIGQVSGNGFSGHVGGIAGDQGRGGQIVNAVYNDADVTLQIGYGALGGIVGYSVGANIDNCHTSASVKLKLEGIVGGSTWIGGIVGDLRESGNVLNCSNSATINGGNVNNVSVGGIAGRHYAKEAQSQLLVQNCVNYGAFAHAANYTGGIIGRVNNLSGSTCVVDRCRNYANVNGDGLQDNMPGGGLVCGDSSGGYNITLTNNFTFLTGFSPFFYKHNGETASGIVTTVEGQENYSYEGIIRKSLKGVNKDIGSRLWSSIGCMRKEDGFGKIILKYNNPWQVIGNVNKVLTQNQIELLAQSIEKYYSELPQ